MENDDHLTANVPVFFLEHEQVRVLIEQLPESSTQISTRENSSDKFHLIISKYSENPHLFDAHLDNYFTLLLSYVRHSPADSDLVTEAFSYMNSLIIVRGFKIAVRHLPHEVSDFQSVLDLLAVHMNSNSKGRYVLLLWLSVICMIPFDMKKFDTTDSSSHMVIDRLIDAAKTITMSVTMCDSDAASYLLSRFFTRPDVIKLRLPNFLQWLLTVVTGQDDQHNNINSRVMANILHLLSRLFKYGKREDLLPFAEMPFRTITENQQIFENSEFVYKNFIKFVQRIGLVYLRPVMTPWRYQRGSRSLAENLQGTVDETTTELQNTDLADTSPEAYDIPEIIEDVINLLLTAVRHKFHMVCWSAAKGLGRICGRLPKDVADDVVHSLVDMFGEGESESTWNGGCLALAELARRGLLLPERLPIVVPIVVRALAYDEKRATMTVGSTVRDSACYVCWAFARAFNPVEIQPYVNEIANALIITSLFDREVKVRQAAAAAFQENVGRQGFFPHGIDILTKADYFAVGVRQTSYLELGPFVAGYPEYTKTIISHVAEVKSQHWDRETRELSSEALAKLTEKSPKYMAKTVLPSLLSYTQSTNICARHGSILAVGNIIFALSILSKQDNLATSEYVGDDVMDSVRLVSTELLQDKTLRGQALELTRHAVCCLIEKVSLASLPFHEQNIIYSWQDNLLSCLSSKDKSVQSASSRGLRALCIEYYKTSDGFAVEEMQDNLLRKYLNALKNSEDVVRVGVCLSLGNLPPFMFHGRLQAVLSTLIEVMEVKDPDWIYTRQSTLNAITKIVSAVGIDGNCERSYSTVCESMLSDIYETVFGSLQDYTINNCGDIGRLVREAAISGVHDITVAAVNSNPDFLTPHIVTSMMRLLLQLSGEKLDKTRGLACKTVASLLQHTPKIPNIPEREYLENLFLKDDIEDVKWISESETAAMVAPLLRVPAYCYHVILGLSNSVGEERVHTCSALINYLGMVAHDHDALNLLVDSLMTIMDVYHGDNRVMVAILGTTAYLLSKSQFTDFLQNTEYPRMMLDKCKKEKSKNVLIKKTLYAADIFCSLLQFRSVRTSALNSIMVLICSAWHKVRSKTAENLYEAILTCGDLVDEDNEEEINDILTSNSWYNNDIDHLRERRVRLCEIFHIKPPIAKKVKPDSKESSNSVGQTFQGVT